MAMRPVYSSDIYAVGVTCIYLLTAKTPKDLEYDPTTGDMMWEHLVHISDHLSNVLKKMLEVSVRNRYQVAQDVLKALEMEAHLDSLSQGLLSQPSGYLSESIQSGADSGNDSINYTRGNNDSVAKLAASIRARRKKTPEKTGSKYEQTQIRKSVPRSSSRANARDVNNHPDTLAVKKLDSQGLLAAYKKGRRDFAGYNFIKLTVPGVNLSETNFHGSQFYKANFEGTNLHNTDFGRVSLKDANLKDTDLTKAYFSNADLEAADLRGANLSHAYLSQANLRGANLSGANLTGAKVTDEQLAVAKTNWLTVRPNGKRGLF
jgi:serine/threonine protein kinase, bacterial